MTPALHCMDVHTVFIQYSHLMVQTQLTTPETILLYTNFYFLQRYTHKPRYIHKEQF